MSSLDAVTSVSARHETPLIVEDAVRNLFEELHHAAPPVALDSGSRLDADLGFDSLARVELLERLERALDVHLPPSALEYIVTVGDLVTVMRSAQAGTARADTRPSAFAAPAVATETASPAGEPAEAGTLIDVMTWRAHRQPQGIHAIVLGGTEPVMLTYRELLEGAQAVAAGLELRGLSAGATVALMLPTSPCCPMKDRVHSKPLQRLGGVGFRVCGNQDALQNGHGSRLPITALTLARGALARNAGTT